MTEIAVVIPTFEEARSIGDVVCSVLSAVHDRDASILVVDDSPTPQTAEVVDIAFADQPHVGVWWRQGDGLASAVRDGMARLDADRYVVLDGDGQHPADEIPALVDALETADIAVGSRHTGGQNDAEWDVRRHAMSFGASALAWAAVPESRRLQDPMSGFFAVRSDVVRPFVDRLDPVGHKILLEILARCPVESIAEHKMTFQPRDAGDSTTDIAEVSRFLWHMARLGVASRRRQRPRRVSVGGEQA